MIEVKVDKGILENMEASGNEYSLLADCVIIVDKVCGFITLSGRSAHSKEKLLRLAAAGLIAAADGQFDTNGG